MRSAIERDGKYSGNNSCGQAIKCLGTRSIADLMVSEAFIAIHINNLKTNKTPATNNRKIVKSNLRNIVERTTISR
jgi:hypothetical protein